MKKVSKNTKKSSKKLIPLPEKTYTGGDTVSLSIEIRNRLSENIFDIKEFDDLLYRSFKEIEQVSDWVENDPISLEKAASFVMSRLMGDNTLPIQKRLRDGVNRYSDEETNIDKYIYYILGYKKTPFSCYRYIKNRVEQDLRSISELLKYYESIQCIKEYKSGENPRTHEDGWIVDFYKRCISEQREILDYYLFGMKERALAKAQNGLYSPNYDAYNDFPYRMAYSIGLSYFDHRITDRLSHRLFEISTGYIPELKKIYELNKEKFYKKLFKIYPTEKIFEDIFCYLNSVPLEKNRIPIFQEMMRLFKGKRWLAFYALTLPQIEGIFTEMLSNTKKSKKLGSLRTKVSMARPFFSLSDSSFDYFEYVVPIMRNRFMHTGFDEDFKVKSFELLTDVHFLLQVFYVFDNPYIKITKVHRKKDVLNFHYFQNLAEYFTLLDNFKKDSPEKYKEYLPKINEFEKEILQIELDFEHIINDAKNTLDSQMVDFKQIIHQYFNIDEHTNFESLSKSNLQTLIASQEEGSLYRLLLYMESQMSHIGAIKAFFNKAEFHLPNLNEGLAKEIKGAWLNKKKFYGNLILLYGMLRSKFDV